jgi:hypothetical protein
LGTIEILSFSFFGPVTLTSKSDPAPTSAGAVIVASPNFSLLQLAASTVFLSAFHKSSAFFAKVNVHQVSFAKHLSPAV